LTYKERYLINKIDGPQMMRLRGNIG